MLKRIKTHALITAATMLPAHVIAADAPEASLPQLDIATYPSQVFWLVASFFLFYILCAGVIVPQLRKLVQTRRSHLTSMMEEANEIAMQAEKYQNRAIETLKKSKTDTHQMLMKKKTKLSNDLQTQTSELTTTAQQKIFAQIDTIKKNVRVVAPEMIEKISADLTSEIIIKLSDIDPEVKVIKKNIKQGLSDKELVA